MKKNDNYLDYLVITILVLMIIFLGSCSAIAGIFKAGVWVGVLIVAGIIALVLYLVSRKGK